MAIINILQSGGIVMPELPEVEQVRCSLLAFYFKKGGADHGDQCIADGRNG